MSVAAIIERPFEFSEGAKRVFGGIPNDGTDDWMDSSMDERIHRSPSSLF